MKSSSASRISPTPTTQICATDELQVVAGYSAPWVNRTPNLMIKSQIRASDLTRTEGVYLGFQATNDAELVPTAEPNRARRFHDSFVYKAVAAERLSQEVLDFGDVA